MNGTARIGRRAGAALLSALLLAGCATKFDPANANGLRAIAIQAPANPDGFQWPYNLRMFQGAPPVGLGIAGAAVGGLALGLAEGVDRNAKANATVTADDIFKATDEKLGDELAASTAAALSKAGYEATVVSQGGSLPAGADAILSIEIGPLGYHCGGFFLEGECTPVLLTRIVLKGKGKTLYDRQCNYGIPAKGCGDEADPALTLPRLRDVLADPARANAGIRAGVDIIASGVARDLAR